MVLISLATFGFAAMVVMALMPHPVMQLSKIPGARAPEPRIEPTWIEGTKRGPVASCLASIGRLVPRSAGLHNRLIYAGVKTTGEEFGGIEVLLAATCSLGVVPLLARLGTLSPPWILLAGAFGFVLPSLWLAARIRRRHRAIVRLLPEVIDLWSLCVGAGLDFLGALNRVVAITMFKKEPLIEELSFALQEVKLGKRRFEAFKAMAKRINLPELSSFVRTLVQADRMGTPVAEVLAIHSEDMRLQRFTRAERAALKAPIKILFPLIFCIMPCIVIIIAVPIFLQFVRMNPFGK